MVEHAQGLPTPVVEMTEDLRNAYDRTREFLGYVPNSVLMMSYRPDMVRAFSELSDAVWGIDTRVDHAQKLMIAHMANVATACQYSVAHTGVLAAEADVPLEKIQAITCQRIDEAFNEAERAALTFARHAAENPNAVTDADVDALRTHFDDDQIAEIMSVIAIMGWLNRWCDTLALELEAVPFEFASRHLAHYGWTPGKHAPKHVTHGS